MLCLLWTVGIAAGLYKITKYSITSAAVLDEPRQWPKDAAIPLAMDRPTMLLSLHPHCACSRATLEELARLLAKLHASINVHILVYEPTAAPDSWAESDLTIRARSMPGVSVRSDVNGFESKRFRMSVSGHTVLYRPDGRLIFSGGITRARGHEGDNAGRRAIKALLSKGNADISGTPVFGCSISDLT
jgi:hypothetical protein